MNKYNLCVPFFILCVLVNSKYSKAQTNCNYTPYAKSFVGNYCDSVPIINSNVNITNADFESGTSGWSYIPNANRAKIVANGYNSSNCIQLKSQNNGAGDVMITQVINSLTPGAVYKLSAMLSSNLASNTNALNISLNMRFNYPNGNSTTLSKVFYPTQTWNLAEHTFTVPTTPGLLSTQVQLLVYRGQNNSVFADDISITSSQVVVNNPTFSFINTNIPIAPANIFNENFQGGMGEKLNCNKWLVVKKTWGNNYVLNNNGVVPENLELVCGGGMRFHGHGDLYNGPINGNTTHLGNGKVRVGACIATKNYYASGLYEVEAKLTPGMVNAFWTFHYIEDASYQNGAIKNSEIDWEFPSNNIAGSKTTIQDGLCNTWGGLCDGEGFHSTTSVNSTMGDLSQDFHKYKIEWHTGGNGIAPSISWYIDSILVKTETNVLHIPFRASRFWLGVWYGNSNWITGGDPSVMQYDDKFMEVKSVKITPFFESNDIYENETVPSDGFTTPNNNPTFPCGGVAARMANTSHETKINDDLFDENFIQSKIENNQLTIKNFNTETYIQNIEVFNMNGQKIAQFSNNINSKNLIFPIVNNLSNGIYIIKTIDNLGSQQTNKINFQQ